MGARPCPLRSLCCMVLFSGSSAGFFSGEMRIRGYGTA
jgi:hypothetical protein